MSIKPFESFQVENFIEWAKNNVSAGYRFQFKSPSADNSLRLYNAFLQKASSTIVSNNIALKAIILNNCLLIPVLHRSSETHDGFTENYISKLRDDVASQNGSFEGTALLIIHNSLLDTIINSSQDLSCQNSIWSVENIRTSLQNLIKYNKGKQDLSLCLLDYQCDIIQNENSTMFGFEKLYYAVEDGKLDFSELDLFPDPLLQQAEGQKAQIKKRLEGNRDLYKHISYEMEYYPEQIEDRMTEFGTKFRERLMAQGDAWKHIEYEEYISEMERNKKQSIEFKNITLVKGTCWERPKSNTKAGLRERHVIIVPNKDQTDLELKIEFIGDGISKEETKILSKNSILKNGLLSTRGRTIIFKTTLPSEVCYFDLRLNREKTSECHKFRCVIIPEEVLSVSNIKDFYIVDASKQRIILKTDTFIVPINMYNYGKAILTDNEDKIDTSKYSEIDFENLWNNVENVQFSLVTASHSVNFIIEGTPADESLDLPLALSQQRFEKLFDDDYYGTTVNNQDKYSVDNCEYKAVALRAKLLSDESRFVNNKILFQYGDIEFRLSDLKQIDLDIYNAYDDLFKYYTERDTLPSLVSWGENYRSIVAKIVQAVRSYFEKIEEGRMLSPDQINIVKIGMLSFEGNLYYSSIHPLTLSYYLELFNLICSNQDNSFKDLPKVTLKRLSPSGLLPYMYNPDGTYYSLTSLPENAFWIKAIPKQESTHEFVRKLVLDKLEEFQKAYSPLFKNQSAPLLVNAVNMHSAEELFWGIVLFIKIKKGNCNPIHINFYDEKLTINLFDTFNNEGGFKTQEMSKKLEQLATKDLLPVILNTLRKKVTHSKFTHNDSPNGQAYAHITFFANDKKAEVKYSSIDSNLSGVAADGLLCGEASECQENSYFTAFGLKNINISDSYPLTLARMYGLLTKPALGINEQYTSSSAITLAVDGGFKTLLARSYDSSIWTTIIDPKVTLDFFKSEKDVTLIHYSDQYTSSLNYDAITVTKQIDLFTSILKSEHACSLSEFNAFNGTWLLGMLTANEKIRKERVGIIAAYKFVASMLTKSDITWVPLSIAEMIRVSGNIGLKMFDSDFAKGLHAGRSGAISDDILFVGFKDNNLYLLPVEVKTGTPPNYSKAVTQARALLEYMVNSLLGKDCLAHKLYRSLFVRQVLIQIDNYRLYNIYEDDYFKKNILNKREEWLRGEYEVSKIAGYVEGIIVAHSESEVCFYPHYEEENSVLKITLPFAFLKDLVGSSLGHKDDRENIIKNFKVPDKYILIISESENLENYLNNTAYDFSKSAPSEEKSITADVNPEHCRDIIIENNTATDELENNKEPSVLPSTINQLKVLCGYDESNGETIFWEPTNTSKLLNPNTGIIGTMGTGKTQFTKSMIAQLVQNQHNNVKGQPIGMLIFDYKSDYVDEQFITATKAKTFKPVNLPYNPLTLFGSFAALPALTAAGFAETMARAYNLGVKQRLKLRTLVMNAYQNFGIDISDISTWSKPAPTIQDIYQLYLEEDPQQDSLYAALDDLTVFGIFEKDSTKVGSLFDILDGVVVLELASYPTYIQNLVVALTLDLFYTQMQKQGKPTIQGDYRQLTKMILVDEADNFMSQDFTSLRKILKEGREYGVGTILSTQEITHFKTSDNDYAAYMQSWVVHRVAKIEGQHTKLLFNISDKNEQKDLASQIGRLSKHQSIFSGGDKKLRIMQDKAFWQLIQDQSKE